MHFSLLRIAVLLIAVTCAVSHADEWPKWLGPAGNGTSTDKIVDQWPAGGPKKLWSQEVGRGFSTAVGLDGKMYVLAMKGQNDVLTALDADTGRVLWSESYEVTHKADKNQAASDNGLPLPDASPTIDGDHIYTYGGGGDLVCRDISNGKLVWKLNVLDETGAAILQWNAGSSPLVTGKFVYVQGGQDGALAVAVDKLTGKVAWKADKGLGGYAAPILVDVDGGKQLIVFGGDALHGLNPADGKTLWRFPWKTSFDVNASTPVYRDGHLFITSGYGHGCAMLKVSATGVETEWQGKEISSKYQPCLLVGDSLIGNSSGRLKCLKWPTRKVLWSNNNVSLGEGGSLVVDGGQIIALSDRGKLSLVHFSESSADVVSEMDVFNDENIWSSPVIYHGKLYVKGKNELVCLDISAK